MKSIEKSIFGLSVILSILYAIFKMNMSNWTFIAFMSCHLIPVLLIIYYLIRARNLFYIVGLVLVMFNLLGIAFRLAHWPGAGILLNLGLFGYAISGFYILIEKKKDSGLSKNDIAYFVSIACAMVIGLNMFVINRFDLGVGFYTTINVCLFVSTLYLVAFDKKPSQFLNVIKVYLVITIFPITMLVFKVFL